jgi:tetratricopeptide (TPR) repeat protein
LKKAAETFEKLLPVWPAQRDRWQIVADIHRELASTYDAIQAAAQAETAMRRFVEIHEQRAAKLSGGPDAELWRARGAYDAHRKQWEKAIANYSKAIDLEPKRWESWSERAVVHLHLRHPDKCVQDCTRAIELRPKHWEPWATRGWAHVELGQWDKVVADFSELLKMSPNDYNAFHIRAVAHTKLNQPELAMADLRQAFAKGYKDLEGVKKDERFAPLRNRKDFKKLLAELEAKTKK